MRKFGEPDRPHEPRNEIEAHICVVLRTLTRQEISRLQTREEYMEPARDELESPMDPGYDYIVYTSTKFEDWYCDGLEFGVNVTAGKITTIQELGSWMT
jgi:hypothetical protein